ncbi:MAG: hypothetical protein ACREDA_13425, partial [Methylocella sp.]
TTDLILRSKASRRMASDEMFIFPQPALMSAFKGFGRNYWFRSGGWGRHGGAHGRRQDLKTPVEQALMRGLVTA